MTFKFGIQWSILFSLSILISGCATMFAPGSDQITIKSDPEGVSVYDGVSYLEGSQIIFANTDFRFYEDGKLRLEAFDLIDVASFSPRDYFFKPLSFKIKTGLTRKMSDEGGERLVWQVNPGIGLAFTNQFMGLYYGLAEIDLNMGGGLRDSYSAGTGIEVGAIHNLTDVWKVQIVAETLLYEWGERFQENKISVVQILRLSRNNSLNLSLLWEEVFNDDRLEAALGWNYYF
ncbi:MAG: hypothetical protein HZA19_00120 [Nitrospirae bacterium]|nr:hypothetical protein [Nitrospirota bacterium]